MSEIRICKDCEVPLIGTMAFAYKEYWCANCGATFPLFNDQPRVERTEELDKLEDRMYEENEEYLRAQGIFYGGAVATDYNGKVTKIKDLPESFMKKLRQDLKKWKPGKYKDKP